MLGQLFRNKSGEGSPASGGGGAALLVLIIAALLVLYVAFLPQDDQQGLLEDEEVPGNPPSSSGGYSHLQGTSALKGHIGEVSAIEDEEIKHNFDSFRLFTKTEASLLSETPRVTIKNSAFQTKSHTMEFSIKPQKTSALHLSYDVRFGEGTLKVYFNGEQVYTQQADSSSKPIELPKNLYKNENVVYMEVSSPGVAFWSTNLYKLGNIMLTAEVKDETDTTNEQMFIVSEEEKEYFKEATFSFYPDCDPAEAGPIDVMLNDESLFHGVPDCHIKNFITVPKSRLAVGENNISFIAESGEYIIDQPKMKVELTDIEHPLYYFELNEDLFKFKEEDTNHCGKIDDVCPDNCLPYEDKDCCFEQSGNNYWCDVKTNNPRDRCVNIILAQHTNRCPSGYEDAAGEPHPDVENTCGDDTDGVCPQGCDKKYDKDCCYDANPDNYWCDDVPFTGMDSTCTPSVTLSECDACPDGYHDKDGMRPNCPTRDDSVNYKDEPELKSGVDVLLRVDFVDRSYKDVDFVINGKTLPVATHSRSITRSIDNMVHYGTNSIVIEPQRDVTIAQIDVRIE